MKRCSTIFLQFVIVLIGIGALAFLLWEPQVEGVNQHATLFEMYFQDPFIAYVYFSSIPFFVALYQTFRVLGYSERDEIFSPAALKALRTIKYCAIAIIGLATMSLVFMIGGDPEDRPAGGALRIFVTFPSIVVATAAAVFERVLQNAVDIKSENDLTV